MWIFLKLKLYIFFLLQSFALQKKNIKFTFAAISLYLFSGKQDGTKTYAYYSEEKTWVDSQEQCRSKHNDMAYIRTEVDNSDIANLVKTWIGALFPNKVWIGLFKDPWVWSDGRETSFRFWLKGSHYWGNCAAVAALQQGRWVERPIYKICNLNLYTTGGAIW
uniref:C-type lectin domain-containing protein n=1 Tax=Lates calcarifer TaxID=8187 RepID=A0A4W6CAY2_LATCA